MAKRYKGVLWLLLVLILAAAVLVSFLFREAILMRLAPKTVLSSAVNRAMFQLEERFRSDPLLLLLQTLDPQGRYAVETTVTQDKPLLGPVTYDMQIQADLKGHQFLADGRISAGETALNASIYLDRQVMAISSPELLNDTYYGITYDSFSSDLMKIPLMQLLVSQELLAQWQEKVLSIQQGVSREYSIPALPEVSRKDAAAGVVLALAAIPCQVSRDSVVLEQTPVPCYKLTCHVQGEKAIQVLSEFSGLSLAKDTQLTGTFFLLEGDLVKLSLEWTGGGENRLYQLTLGQSPLTTPLSLEVSENGTAKRIWVDTVQDQDWYQEDWQLETTEDSGARKTSRYSYQWVPSSGHMHLSSHKLSQGTDFVFRSTGSGIALETDNLQQILAALDQAHSSKSPLAGSVTLERGSGLTAPSYKNLDQWSMEDFVILLTGLGGLLGIPTP